MTAELTASLTHRIQQTVRLDDINACAKTIADCYHQGKILKQEHQHLLDLHKKQLKLVLDLNLLPTPAIIEHCVEKTDSSEKIDPAEITEADFQVIEQEAIRLNRARLDYIQANFFSQSSSLNFGHSPPPEPKQLSAWEQLLHVLRLK